MPEGRQEDPLPSGQNLLDCPILWLTAGSSRIVHQRRGDLTAETPPHVCAACWNTYCIQLPEHSISVAYSSRNLKMTHTNPLEVIIIGAGIAGLATAYGLQDLPGVRVRILEKRKGMPRITSHGYILNVQRKTVSRLGTRSASLLSVTFRSTGILTPRTAGKRSKSCSRLRTISSSSRLEASFRTATMESHCSTPLGRSLTARSTRRARNV